MELSNTALDVEAEAKKLSSAGGKVLNPRDERESGSGFVQLNDLVSHMTRKELEAVTIAAQKLHEEALDAQERARREIVAATKGTDADLDKARKNLSDKDMALRSTPEFELLYKDGELTGLEVSSGRRRYRIPKEDKSRDSKAQSSELNLFLPELRFITVANTADFSEKVKSAWGERPSQGDKNIERTAEQKLRDNKANVLIAFESALKDAKVEDVADKVQAMTEMLSKSESRLNGLEMSNHLYSARGEKLSATGQMERIYGALNAVLEGKPPSPFNVRDRANWALSAAAEVADPSKYSMQGHHNTCVLRSLTNQRLQAGDPAAVLEEAASTVLRGGAFVGENGLYGRKWSSVDAWSVKPFRESRVFFDKDYEENRRSLFAQTTDALLGQVASDLQTARAVQQGRILAGSKYVYTTAHAIELGASTRSGEATFLQDAAGESKYLYEFPLIITPLDQAELNQHVTGEKGAVFAHQDLQNAALDGQAMVINSSRPAGYEGVVLQTFKDGDDFSNKLEAFQKRTGKPAQSIVRAEFLPNDPSGARGLHSVLFGKNGEAITLDNNWGQTKDSGAVQSADLERATNPAVWEANGVKYERKD